MGAVFGGLVLLAGPAKSQSLNLNVGNLVHISANGPSSYVPPVIANVVIDPGTSIVNMTGAPAVSLTLGGTAANTGTVTLTGGSNVVALNIGVLGGMPSATPGDGDLLDTGIINVTTPSNGTGLNVTVLGNGSAENAANAALNVTANTGNATGIAVTAGANAALQNAGIVTGVVLDTGAGTGTGTGAMLIAGVGANLNVLNTGSLLGQATTDTGAAVGVGLNLATVGGMNVLNTGTVTANALATLGGTGAANGIVVNATGTLGNVLTNTGFIMANGTVNAALHTHGIDVESLTSPLVINNSGTIASTGVGVYVNPTVAANVALNLNGGSVSSGNGLAAIQLGAGNNIINLNDHASVSGLINGGATHASNTLNVNLFGVTPAQQAAGQAALLTANVNAALNPTGTQTLTIGGQLYLLTNINLLGGNLISLELSVDAGLGGLAVAIDNNGGLPVALAPPNGGVGVDPEQYLNSLTGRQFLDAYSSISLGDAASFVELADNRAFDIRHGASGLDVSQLYVAPSSMIASLGQDSAMLQGLGNARMGGTEMSDSKTEIAPNPLERPRAAFWAAGTVNFIDESGHGGVMGYTGRTGSPTLGFDYRVAADLTVGALVHLWSTEANFGDGSRLGVETIFAGPYATWSHDGWYVNALAGGGYSNYDNRRQSPGAGIAQSSPVGNEIIANISGGYDFNVAGWKVSPIIGLNYTHVGIGNYTESGAGAFDLSVGNQDIDSLRSKVGFHIARDFQCGSVTLTPEVHASWWHEFLNENRSVQESLDGAPAIGQFSVGTLEPDSDFAMVGAGLSATPRDLGEDMTFFLTYNAQAGEQYLAHTINGGVRIGF